MDDKRTERQKVITNLQIIWTWATVDQHYGGIIGVQLCKKIAEWTDDALTLITRQADEIDRLTEKLNAAEEMLKAAWPRVLTWNELWTDDHPSEAWAEDKMCPRTLRKVFYDPETKQYWDDEKEWHLGLSMRNEDEYGRFYRLWTREPTERDRMEVLWDA